MYPVSAAFIAAATSPGATVVSAVEVWDNQHTFIQEVPNILSWSVKGDESSQVRTTATVDLISNGQDGLIPKLTTDILHPVTLNEIRIKMGYVLPDGTEEYAYLGTFVQTQMPKVVNDGSGGADITLTLSDRSATVSALAWTEPFPIDAGTDVAAAIFAVINTQYPNLVYLLTPTNPVPGGATYTTSALNLGIAVITSDGTGSTSATSDPMADAITLAQIAGMELFFDVDGFVVSRVIPDPTQLPVLASYIYASEETPWLHIESDPNTLGLYNGVIVIANASHDYGPFGGTNPIQNSAYDNDPTSPTYSGGPWGKRPFTVQTSTFPSPGQDVFDAIAQAEQVAIAILQLILGFQDIVTVDTIPNPAMQIGDCIYLYDPTNGIDGNYVISTLSLSNAFGGTMTFTCRPQKRVIT